MEPFIKKHEFNAIRKLLRELHTNFRTCPDQKMITIQKATIQEKIHGLFEDLSVEEKQVLTIDQLTEPLQIEHYEEQLEALVIGIPLLTQAQAQKLFKKEKKLRVPEFRATQKVYFGWTDLGTNKHFVVSEVDKKWAGMACRLIMPTSKQMYKCSLCDHFGDESEILNVSPMCKTLPDEYHSIAFNICTDSEACNERMTSTENLTKLLKKVNRLK